MDIQTKQNRILVIVDQLDWAFDHNAEALQKHCHEWQVDIIYGKADNYQSCFNNHNKYDLVLFLPDFRTDVIMRSPVPKEKFLVAIRSDVLKRGISFYQDQETMQKRVGALLVSNSHLFEKFYQLHPVVRFAPGGVDIHTFVPFWRESHKPPIVGWAGSKDNFGKNQRGLDMIERACEHIGYLFHPAYREEKWRTISEMVKYYQYEIDIYCDMDLRAGRQNGLLEAASCGKACISTPQAGISGSLIQSRQNGLLVHYNMDSLISSMELVVDDIEKYGRTIREDVERKWSWEAQTGIFENIFNEMIN